MTFLDKDNISIYRRPGKLTIFSIELLDKLKRFTFANPFKTGGSILSIGGFMKHNLISSASDGGYP